MSEQRGTPAFQPGDRVIFDGQYIGWLLHPVGAVGGLEWAIRWEDGVETNEASFPQTKLVHANGGPTSAKRDAIMEAWTELSAAAAALGTAVARFQNARDAYIKTDPYHRRSEQ